MEKEKVLAFVLLVVYQAVDQKVERFNHEMMKNNEIVLNLFHPKYFN